ncbi:MAG: phosphatase [Deltaproteobacteria bacterium]|jgi:histidinol phosphatase-like enzyme (inositol monophosphatase family)|nr:phosphatase [Deltaproteobacteria bacterium]
MMDIEEFLSFACKMADLSRQIILRPKEVSQSFELKDDLSPVTIIDCEIEETLKKTIAEKYPEHGFFGEETGRDSLHAPFSWVIDPLDGTKAFIAGLPVYSTLIALTFEGNPILGVMDFPATQERFVAHKSGLTYRNGLPCRTRLDPKEPIMAISNPEGFEVSEKPLLDKVRSLASFAVYGGSSYVYGSLAAGRIDLAMDSGLDPFDYLALAPVIERAGGLITDWEGNNLTINSGRRILASGSPRLHAKAIEIINS